jgi:predicted chitinase
MSSKYKGRGLVQLTGRDSMSSLLHQNTATSVTLGQMPSAVSMGGIAEAVQAKKSFSNKKISLHVHQANGGYVVEVEHPVYGIQNELYIVSEDNDLGQELGKIITHNKLKT